MHCMPDTGGARCATSLSDGRKAGLHPLNNSGTACPTIPVTGRGNAQFAANTALFLANRSRRSTAAGARDGCDGRDDHLYCYGQREGCMAARLDDQACGHIPVSGDVNNRRSSSQPSPLSPSVSRRTRVGAICPHPCDNSLSRKRILFMWPAGVGLSVGTATTSCDDGPFYGL